MIIGDRVAPVAFKLGNRTDLNDNISYWIAYAYQELCSNIPFPDMERSDVLTLVVGTNVYNYPTNARGILAFTMTVNGQPRPLKKKNIEYTDNYPVTSPGIPVIWAPYNYQHVIKPIPDGAYTIQRRFWIAPVVDVTSPTTINATVLQIPFDWFEIIDYAAALRGFTDLQNHEKAQSTRVILYGDPKHPEQPGLIRQHLTQIMAENMNSDYGMRMRIRPYTSSQSI